MVIIEVDVLLVKAAIVFSTKELIVVGSLLLSLLELFHERMVADNDCYLALLLVELDRILE